MVTLLGNSRARLDPWFCWLRGHYASHCESALSPKLPSPVPGGGRREGAWGPYSPGPLVACKCVCVCECVRVKSLRSCLTLCNPMDCSLPGSSVHGILQARIWSGLPCPPPGDLPNPGMEPTSLMSPALAGRFFTTSATWEAQASCRSIHIHRFWVGNKMHIG